jgi:uncharacterized protein (DUF1499 family)
VPFRGVQLRLAETEVEPRALAIETINDHLRQRTVSVRIGRSCFGVNKRIENEVRTAV